MEGVDTLLTSQRWWSRFPFLLALVSLVFLGWSAYLAFSNPHDGILNSTQSGQIRELDDFGKDINQFQDNDLIVSVEGVPFREAIPLYAGLHAGDEVDFVIDRRGELISLTVRLVDPPIEVIISGAVILIVALIFWGMGVGVLSFKPGDITSNLFFLFTQVSALLLASGLSSSIGPDWTSNIFNALIWFIGPIAVHLHYYFPQQVQFRYKRAFLIGLYCIAIVGGTPNLIFGTRAVLSNPWSSQLFTYGLIFLAVNLAIP